MRRSLPALLLFVAACGGGEGPTGPEAKAGIRAVAGSGIVDTVLAQPLQALVVEVRDSSGKPAVGAVVRFEAAPPSDTTRRSEAAIYACRLSDPVCGPSSTYPYPYPYGQSAAVVADTTDAAGRAKVTVRLGTVAGTSVVRLTVPEFGMRDSTAFTVRAGAAARVRLLPADTALAVGAQATLRAAVVDRFGNARTEQPTLTTTGNGVADLDAARAAVTGRAYGSAWVLARSGTAVDSAVVRVVPSGRLVAWDPQAQTILLTDFDGGNRRTLATGAMSDIGTFPRFSADRSQVTFQTGRAQFGGPPTIAATVDTTGANRRDAGAGGSPALSNVHAVRKLADGTVLFVARRGTDPYALTAPIALWRVAVDGTMSEVAVLPEMSVLYGTVDISPDGSKVAYLVGAGGQARNGLRALDVATGASTLIDANGRSPRWSPAGDRVAYLVPSGGGFDGVLMVANADGTNRRGYPTRVFSPGLAWSPDGAYVLGRNPDYSSVGLRLVRLSDGSEVVIRLARGASPEAPAGAMDLFQPDWR